MTPKDWTPTTLGQFVEIKHGLAFKGDYFRDEPPGDILLTPGNFAIGGGFKDDKFKYYVGPVPEEYVLEENDLLVTMTDLSKQADTLGYSALVPKSDGRRYLHNQRLGKVEIQPGAPLRNEYLYFLLRTPAYRREVVAGATGTTVKHTSPARIKAFKFLRPPIREQEEIARVLGNLERKIEQNRRTNRTLEAMAAALFRAWFVDFEPVRGKAEGRIPAGLTSEVAALFPGSLDRLRARRIPTGWDRHSLSEAVELIGGGTPKTSEPSYWGGEIPWFAAVDLPSEGDVFVIDTARRITQAGLENSAVRILPLRTTIITARGTVGKLAVVGAPMAMNQSCYGVRGKAGRGDYFTYYVLREAIDELRRRTHGSVFDTITQDTFKTLSIVAVPTELTQLFDAAVEPFMERILANLKEAKTLAELRDTLLPKMLSGEVRVRGAEREVGSRM